MPEPFDNARITDLVLCYQSAVNGSRDPLFCEIVNAVLPLLRSTIFRYRWHLTLDESPDELVNVIVLKMPRMLLSWKIERGKPFAQYFLSVVMNTFRHAYSKRQRRSKYAGDWPLDDEGCAADIPDDESERLTGDVTTMTQRGVEFESLMFRIPDDLARCVGAEYSGLVRFVAERYLQRADNSEALYFTELRKEVAAFPSARSLTEREVDALVRMVIAGVRARLYALRGAVEEVSAEGFLSWSTCRMWPLMLILDPATTRLVLYSLAGLVDSVPVRSKWARDGMSDHRQYQMEAAL